MSSQTSASPKPNQENTCAAGENASNESLPSSRTKNSTRREVGTKILEYSDVLKSNHNARRHSNGYWSGTDVSQLHQNFTDSAFATQLPRFFENEKNVNSIIDIGCGNGVYSQGLADSGFLVNCYDGNPDTQVISNGRCAVLDFSQKVNLLFKYDWVLSLKVGKHIPKQYEDNYIHNLDTLNTKGIVMSWGGYTKAVGGKDHFNDKPDTEIIDKFEKMGYFHDLKAEAQLKGYTSTVTLKDRLLVFRKIKSGSAE